MQRAGSVVLMAVLALAGLFPAAGLCDAAAMPGKHSCCAHRVTFELKGCCTPGSLQSAPPRAEAGRQVAAEDFAMAGQWMFAADVRAVSGAAFAPMPEAMRVHAIPLVLRT